MKKIAFFLSLLILNIFGLTAQYGGFLTPGGIDGEVIYIPYPMDITLDGDNSDWEGVRQYTVDRGPYIAGMPDDNGQFTFSVCADMENFYFYMTMPDKNIVAGEHEEEYWNEDSFEFFLNYSGDMDAREYKENIIQVNINATDIGNTDPHGLNLTGSAVVVDGDYDIYGYVFETDEGWGMEVAVSMKGLAIPIHGTTFGMQFQANGASSLDRDTKLIWSKYDVSDKSWMDPHVFGAAVFFEIGREDIPESTRDIIPEVIEIINVPVEERPWIRLNQLGFFPGTPKLAVLKTEKDRREAMTDTPLVWELLDSEGIVVEQGDTQPAGYDYHTDDSIHYIDFSKFKKIGEGYTLRVGERLSHPFDIRNDLYQSLKFDGMSYFYMSRGGIPVEENFVGSPWAHSAYYESDASVKPFSGTDSTDRLWPESNYTLNAAHGWFDGSDYGKYVVNGATALWTLLNMYERNNDVFIDGLLAIPEGGNGIPDVLDEAKWEMDFILGMQIPQGQPLAGMVYHKLHQPYAVNIPMKASKRVEDRYAYGPSTAATLNLAATAAQFARLIEPYDSDYAQRSLAAAKTAWAAALKTPELLFENTPGEGGSNYMDDKLSDEFFWAAAELFITTGEQQYGDYLESTLMSEDFLQEIQSAHMTISWAETAPAALLSLLVSENNLSSGDLDLIKNLVIQGADEIYNQLFEEGYAVSLFTIPLNSNGQVANHMIVLAYAHQWTGKHRYLDGMIMDMDYLLGRNGRNKSFISGYGDYSLMYPYHPYWADKKFDGFPPPPPGVMASGANMEAGDPGIPDAMSFTRLMRYNDHARSSSTNGVNIAMNAPLVWVSAYLDEQLNPQSSIPAVKAKGISLTLVFSILGGLLFLFVLWLFLFKRIKP
ncbi:MAG: glycoside hydrolase family 9 protein [Spirochaetaceae bacterium]|jgi:endoglucanase|nr:glycoside hydrolase family 9 protein [Spirochaetaceae bacterium]